MSLPIRWTLKPTDTILADWLDSASAGDMASTCDTIGIRIKDGAHRTVWRLEGPWGSIHVKRNPLHNLRAWARRCFRKSKAALEAHNAQRLSNRQVPTVEVLALGEESSWRGASWIVTRTLSGGVGLDQVLVTPGAFNRVNMAVLLGQTIARMHGASAFHPDLHPGNLLLTVDGTLHILDIHDLEWTNPTLELRIRNLVLLNRWFQLRCPAWDRYRFLRAYLNEWKRSDNFPDLDPRAMARDIEKRTFTSNQKLWKGRDLRCLGNNRDFVRRTKQGCSVMHLRDCQTEVIDLLQNSAPEERLASIFKKSASSTVGLVPLFASSTHRSVVLKIIPHRRPVIDWIRSWFETPGQKAWKLGHALRARGLPTPIPLAYRSKMGIWGGDERLVVEFLADSRQLDLWWREAPVAFFQKRDLLKRLARIVATMHTRGVRHRDLKSANIMIDCKHQPWIIDLAGASLNRSVSQRTCEKDLARMARSGLAIGMALTGYLIFFKAYSGNRLSPDWKKQWRQISRLVEKAMALQQKRGRPAG